MAGKPKSIDDYLSRLPDDQRQALEKLRRMIHAAAPKADEAINYQIPMFRHNGMLVGFGARKGLRPVHHEQGDRERTGRGSRRLRHQHRHHPIFARHAVARGAGEKSGEAADGRKRCARLTRAGHAAALERQCASVAKFCVMLHGAADCRANKSVPPAPTTSDRHLP